MTHRLSEADIAYLADMKRRGRNWRARDMRENGHRTPAPVLVRCWWCGARAWRRWYKWDDIVMRKTKVRCFGRCYRIHVRGDDRWDNSMCRGFMFADGNDVRFVRRAAWEYDNAGFNRTSEYDR